MIADLEALPDSSTGEDLPADMDCVYAGDHPDECRRPGVVVNCMYCIKPWGPDPRKVRMWTPCCGRVRQCLRSGAEVSCPACGWRWKLYVLGWTNRIVSLGPSSEGRRTHA